MAHGRKRFDFTVSQPEQLPSGKTYLSVYLTEERYDLWQETTSVL